MWYCDVKHKSELNNAPAAKRMYGLKANPAPASAVKINCPVPSALTASVVIRVDDLEELIATSQALAILKNPPKGTGLAAISLSGGETGICADVGQLSGLEYFDFSKDTLQKLNDILSSYATLNNPLDSIATLSYDAEAWLGFVPYLSQYILNKNRRCRNGL